MLVVCAQAWALGLTSLRPPGLSVHSSTGPWAPASLGRWGGQGPGLTLNSGRLAVWPPSRSKALWRPSLPLSCEQCGAEPGPSGLPRSCRDLTRSGPHAGNA